MRTWKKKGSTKDLGGYSLLETVNERRPAQDLRCKSLPETKDAKFVKITY